MDFETVVGLVRELPDEYRKQAAMQLSWLLKRAEEELFMSEDEVAQLRQLEKERSSKLAAEIRDWLKR